MVQGTIDVWSFFPWSVCVCHWGEGPGELAHLKFLAHKYYGLRRAWKFSCTCSQYTSSVETCCRASRHLQNSRRSMTTSRRFRQIQLLSLKETSWWNSADFFVRWAEAMTNWPWKAQDCIPLRMAPGFFSALRLCIGHPVTDCLTQFLQSWL